MGKLRDTIRSCCLVGAALCGLLGINLGTVRAQDKAQVLVRLDKKDKFADLKAVRVRPNVTQTLYLQVGNLLPVKTAMTVQISATRAGEVPVVLATADLGEVEAGAIKPVTAWQAPAAAKPSEPVPPSGTAPAPKPEPGVELEGAPFSLLIKVLAPKLPTPLLFSKSLDVRIRTPGSYVSVSDIEYRSDAVTKTNKLTVRVKADAEFTGQPCRVSLDLRPALIPGLRPERAKGTYGDELTERNQEVTLSAENLKFADAPPKVGLVYLTVDDYERAFIYKTEFTRARVTPDPMQDPALRILVPAPYLRPTKTMPVRLEVDNPPEVKLTDPPLKLRFGLDRDRNGKVEGKELRELVGDRQQRVRVLPPAADGALLLKTDVRPWAFELNTADLYDDYEVKASIDYKEKMESKTLESSVKVVFDDTPPADVAIRRAALSAVLVPGKPLLLEATAVGGASPMTEAVFFLGKPLPDKKGPPPDAVKVAAELTKGKDNVWVAKGALPLPGDIKSPTVVSVIFTNAVGLSNADTAVIEWTPPPPIKPFIAGIVVEGDLLQPNLDVVLIGADRKPVTTVQTNGKGEYIFKDVEPGSYRVYAAKAGGSMGDTPVTIKAGEKKEGVAVKLRR